eukprot:GILJ01000737.1.p1 GENE.GILJ01000737.1~~GILJ01000737.1.p1  ORF type:complete len:415 (-),score=67.79 GILJ01000737.1:231-1475(-)
MLAAVGRACRASLRSRSALRFFSANKPAAYAVTGREALLFTPGPLTTSPAVKQAMLQDLGSRDDAFLKVVKDVRTKLLTAAGASKEQGYECIIMQGSGTFAVEAVIGSAVPRKNGKMLIVANGAYGERMAKICEVLGIDHTVVRYKDFQVPQVDDVVKALRADPSITTVGCIHSETTSGAINDIHAIGLAVKAVNPKIHYIVDAMSSFGAYSVNLEASNISYLVSSSNKCIEGVPGFAFILAKRSVLETTQGYARSLSLNVLDQWKGLEASGQFRFTPPTHSLLAFHQALVEFEQEGGVDGRGARYRANQQKLAEGMTRLGFKSYLEPSAQGCIITTFLEPTDSNYDFKKLYDALAAKGLVIYPGKLTAAPSFRIGSIGRLFPRDVEVLLLVVEQTLRDMGVTLPVQCKDFDRS